MSNHCQLDVNEQDSRGWTALHRAAWRGDHRTAEDLVGQLADVDAATVRGGEDDDESEGGLTALHLAVRQGHVDVVRLLLTAQADPNASSNKASITPLNEAIAADNVAMVKLLLDARAATDSPKVDQSSFGSALFAAAASGCSSGVAEALIRIGSADVNFSAGGPTFQPEQGLPDRILHLVGTDVRNLSRSGVSVMQAAAMASSLEVVQLLVTSMADVDVADDDGISALTVATSLGDTEIVAELVASQASVNLQNQETGWSPLHYAASSGFLEICQMLIDSGAELDALQCNLKSALCYAAQNGHVGVVELLLRSGASVDIASEIGWSSLHLAALNGHTQVAALLLAAGSNVDLADDDGFTPLFMAAQHGYKQLAALLIQHGASVDWREIAGGSPMQIAAQHDHPDVVSLLIQSGAEIDLRENIGWTALFVVAQHGRELVAETLISSGCQVDICEYDSWTALHVAALFGHGRVAGKLIASGADIRLVDRHGWSAADFAAALGHLDVLRMLLTPDAQESRRPALPVGLDSAALSSEMTAAGFNSSSARIQGAVGSALQDILRLQYGNPHFFVFGSFADGWGSCLSGVDGRIDADSDVDITRIQDRPCLHIPNPMVETTCQRSCIPVLYNDGHVTFQVNVTRPNQVSEGSVWCPAIDEITAYPCCGYPQIAVLQRGYKTCMSAALLADLGEQILTSRCHAVSASPPGLEGSCMRVSTTHLEQTVMRHLNTVQGQLFIVLKFLIKKVIARRVTGLKTYHAKNLLFFMLDQTPEELWRPENLVCLVMEALEMLQLSLQQPSQNARECMKHFFLRDAAVYLRGDHQPKSEISKVVSDVLNQLPELMAQFTEGLRCRGKYALNVKFHPFMVLTSIRNEDTSIRDIQCQYHQIYFVVEEALLKLADPLHTVPSSERRKQFKEVIQLIEVLPDSARTAREALRALAHIKFGKRIDFLNSDSFRSTVHSRGFPCSPGDAEPLSFKDAKRLVWEHLKHLDSAWRFCFMWNTKPEYEFLPDHFQEAFPYPLRTYNNYYYMNFDALIKTLQLEFCPYWLDLSATFTELLESTEADPQEVLMALHFCRDDELLVRIVHRHCEAVSAARLTDEVIAEYKRRHGMLKACEQLVMENSQLQISLKRLFQC